MTGGWKSALVGVTPGGRLEVPLNAIPDDSFAGTDPDGAPIWQPPWPAAVRAYEQIRTLAPPETVWSVRP